MSQPRVVTSRIAIAMTALVINSTVAYVVGRPPAIFDGLAFLVLVCAWMVCVTTWILAERGHRAAVRERAKDYRLWLMIDKYRPPSDRDSGSWRRSD